MSNDTAHHDKMARFLCHAGFETLFGVYQDNKRINKDLRLGAPDEATFLVVGGLTKPQIAVLNDTKALVMETQRNDYFRHGYHYGYGQDEEVDTTMKHMISVLTKRRDMLTKIWTSHKDWQQRAEQAKKSQSQQQQEQDTARALSLLSFDELRCTVPTTRTIPVVSPNRNMNKKAPVEVHADDWLSVVESLSCSEEEPELEPEPVVEPIDVFAQTDDRDDGEMEEWLRGAFDTADDDDGETREAAMDDMDLMDIESSMMEQQGWETALAGCSF